MENKIALEREQYISELTSQVVAKVEATIEQKLVEIQNYANLVDQVSPKSFTEVSEIFKNVKSATEGDKVLLLSKTGSVYLFDGTTIRVDDSSFLADVGNGENVLSTFSPLGSLGDYWMFGSPIKHLTISNIEMVAIISANKNTTFSEQMTVAMFEHQTYSFLIDDFSNILIKPENTTAYGINLINSLFNSGISQSEKDLLLNNIADHEIQSVFFNLDGERWLIQTSFVRDNYSVALLLPLQITSSATIMALNQTMLLVSVLLFVTMSSLLFVVVITIKSNANKRIQQEQFNMKLVEQTARNKTDFLSKMSHDIRTPLNGIIGMTYLGIDNIDNRPALEDNLAKIQSSSEYLLALLNDILDMSKIDSGKMKINYEPGNVEEILPQIVSFFEPQANAKKIRISIVEDTYLPNSYLLDNLRIKQVLTNLISNSIKFTSSEGKIDLSLEVIYSDDKTDQIIYTIADNGVGMSEEFMSRIFSPFEQESTNTAQLYGGSGLGLSIVKSLVDLMGGTITVASHVGKGSTFKITIPMKRIDKFKNSSPNKDILLKINDKKLKEKRVLLVEDHPINAQIASKILDKIGLKVEIAENGKVALDLFLESEKGYYSMILMDIQMPIMDGYEATRQIRASAHLEAKTIPIYAMSANYFEEDIRNSLEAGMNGHLRKPIETSAIKKVIQDEIIAKEIKDEKR